jgi:nucleoside-diphosphate-sugar epimerase
MRIFVAGATGVIGQPLVRQLTWNGHEVVGMTRKPEKQTLIRELGAEPAVADALDAEAVATAVSQAEPEAIIHQLTSLSDGIDMRKMDEAFALTNRLRTEGTDHLLSAGRALGVRKFIAQSFAGWPYAKVGGPVKTEDDPLDPNPPEAARTGIDAIRHLERSVTEADWTEGIVLRYGGFYGPGTSLAVDPPGEQMEMLKKRMLPIIGDGGGVWSLVHVDDAASATVAALECGKPGIYNVVDDEPARVRDLLPEVAEAVGAKRPLRLPRWIGRLAAGEVAVLMMTEARGASNEKAKRELGWSPRYPRVLDGLAAETA